jgi:sugar phosphate isomerase/epimerase
MIRVGTTSYIIPADILPNAEFLAGRVDDIQLVLFETDEHGSNLPDAGVCRRLAGLAAEHSLSWTVHLPLDLRLGASDAAQDVSLVKARRVIEATRALAPLAFTVHLDGRELAVGGALPGDVVLARWQANARRALECVGDWLPEPARLCVENLERWDPEAFAPVIEALPVSRTIDIGHFWLQGQDPLPHLRRWLPRTRVVHLHGVDGRDHQSLRHVPPAALRPVLDLLRAEFAGVLTLEVFAQRDLEESLDILARHGLRPQAARPAGDGHGGGT